MWAASRWPVVSTTSTVPDATGCDCTCIPTGTKSSAQVGSEGAGAPRGGYFDLHLQDPPGAILPLRRLLHSCPPDLW
eukprot:scaffold227176_cov41-Prasinocladus_malaysianus.AAC.1